MTTTSSPDVVCAGISRRLADALGARRFAMWFDRSARFGYDDEHRRLDLAVPNQFVADWIGRHFDAEIRQAAAGELGEAVDLRVEIKPEFFAAGMAAAGQSTEAATLPARAETRKRRITEDGRIGKGAGVGGFRHRLDDFVVGPSNELAFAAAGRLADQDHDAANPLFMHGGCGLGKTHLLQGLCQKMLDRHPQAKVLYLTGEQFTNEFLAAVRANNVAAFRKKIRRLDLLAVDDIHFFANKSATQQEFLHSFDAIDMGGARLALASDSHPKLIKLLSEALVSRCVRGLVVEIKPPDTATRARIVRSLAQKRGMPLVDTVIEVLASRCTGSVREIEGTLAKLHALATLSQEHQGPSGQAIGHALVNRLFDAGVPTTPRRAVRFSAILDTVVEQLGIPKAEVLGQSRRQPAVLARSLAIHLTRRLTGMSYPEIAAAMGRSAHSTIITADQRLSSQAQAGKSIVLPSTLEEIPLPDLIERLKHAVSRA